MNLRHRGPAARHRARCELAWELFDAYIDASESAESQFAVGHQERAEYDRERRDFHTRLVQLFGPEPLATR